MGVQQVLYPSHLAKLEYFLCAAGGAARGERRGRRIDTV